MKEEESRMETLTETQREAMRAARRRMFADPAITFDSIDHCWEDGWAHGYLARMVDEAEERNDGINGRDTP